MKHGLSRGVARVRRARSTDPHSVNSSRAGRDALHECHAPEVDRTSVEASIFRQRCSANAVHTTLCLAHSIVSNVMLPYIIRVHWPYSEV